MEMLNQRMSDSAMRHVFGVGPRGGRPPEVVLLDEVHLYAGTYGAQVAFLLRRWSALTRRRSSFVGLSATIADGKRFFASLTGFDEMAVEEIAPHPDDMEREGAEYLLALRGDPVSQTALLSTSIQTMMLTSRLLDPRSTINERPFYGWRAFAFTDQMDATNRLYYDLLDAEGRDANGRENFPRRPNGGLAVLRDSLPSVRRYDGGQDWRVCKEIGHELDFRNHVGRTTAYDKGVNADAEVIIATAALEVGYDDPYVGVVLQHKAPRELAPFLQRKGRAGRTRHMRPWTIMVLSDYGRDRLAYQAYEQFFDPDLPSRALPLRNRYVRRMQAVYALIDYLGVRTQASEPSGSAWRDLSAPRKYLEFEALAPEVRQRVTELADAAPVSPTNAQWKALSAAVLSAVAAPGNKRPRPIWDAVNWVQQRLRRRMLVGVLAEILRGGPALTALGQKIAQALDITESETDTLLWEHPRPLVTEVVPTALRRLATDWTAFGVAHQDLYGQSPLPDFIPAMLFNDLNVPEVSLIDPSDPNSDSPRGLPVKQALTEFAPGKVSRRLDDALWLGPERPLVEDILDHRISDATVACEVDYLYRLEAETPFLRTVDGATTEVPTYRPLGLKLRRLPGGPGNAGLSVRDTSNARLLWHSQIFASRIGLQIESPTGRVGIANIFERIVGHTHATQSPAVVRRYAVASDANLVAYRGSQRCEARARFTFVRNGEPCGIGFGFEADAIVFSLIPNVRVTQSSDLLDPSTLRAARAARYLWEAQNGIALAAAVDNVFQRQWLALIFQIAATLLAEKENCDLSDAIRRLGEGEFADMLPNVLVTIFQSPAGPTPDEADDDSDGSGGARQAPVASSDRLRVALTAHLANQQTVLALSVTARPLHEVIDHTWDSWLNDTGKQTLAAAILEAIQQACPEVDASELDVDLEPGPREDGTVATSQEIWVSESTPGGNGQVEQILAEIAQRPERFFRLVEASLRASEFETIDSQLRLLLAAIGGNPRDRALAAMVADVRGALDVATTEAAFHRLRQGLIGKGQVLFHGYLVALSSRVLRAGMPSGVDAIISDVLVKWDALEARLGVEVDARVVAALSGTDTRLDDAFRLSGFDLPPVISQTWRYNVIYGLLWARGHALRAGLLPLYSAYSSIPAQTERLLLVHWLSPPETSINGHDPSWHEEACRRLAESGAVAISVRAGDSATLRDVIKQLVIEPIQLEYLNLYVRLRGIRRSATANELIVELPENG
jgi:hypothetical protein